MLTDGSSIAITLPSAMSGWSSAMARVAALTGISMLILKRRVSEPGICE